MPADANCNIRNIKYNNKELNVPDYNNINDIINNNNLVLGNTVYEYDYKYDKNKCNILKNNLMIDNMSGYDNNHLEYSNI